MILTMYDINLRNDIDNVFHVSYSIVFNYKHSNHHSSIQQWPEHLPQNDSAARCHIYQTFVQLVPEFSLTVQMQQKNFLPLHSKS